MPAHGTDDSIRLIMCVKIQRILILNVVFRGCETFFDIAVRTGAASVREEGSGEDSQA